MTLARRS